MFTLDPLNWVKTDNSLRLRKKTYLLWPIEKKEEKVEQKEKGASFCINGNKKINNQHSVSKV